MEDFPRLMWLLPVVAQSAAGIRIAVGPDTSKHAFLLALIVSMLSVETIGNVAGNRFTAQGYFRFWLVGYLANVSFVALALTEASTRSIESYERFGRTGQRITKAVLAGSGTAMLILLFVLPAPLAAHYCAYFQAQAYLGQASLALLGLSLLALASWARLRLHRNAKLTIIVLTALCGAEGILGSTMSAAWPSARVYLGIFATLFLWGLLIGRWSTQPDLAPGTPRRVSPGDAAPALARMEAMNRQLGELVRRG